jgi:hypothetical protein
MSEELNVSTIIENAPAENVSVSAELSIEDQARAEGWVPLDEFKGNPDNWADAKEFTRVGKIIKARDEKSSKLEREIKELKSITKNLLSTMQKTEQVAYEKASKDLNAQLHRAKEIGDVEEALHVTKQQQVLEQQIIQQQAQNQISLKDTEEFQRFHAQNKWVTSQDRVSKAMQQVATDISNEYALKHPGASVEEELKYVHEEIRKEFPEKFKDERAEAKASSVLSGNSIKSSSPSASDKLSTEEKTVIDYLKLKGYDVKSYMKALGK